MLESWLQVAGPAGIPSLVVPLLVWRVVVVLWVQGPEWAERAEKALKVEEGQVQVYLVALEDRQGRWVQQTLEAPLTLQVLVLLCAPVALVVLVSLVVHPCQEVLKALGHLFHQGFQVGLQTLSNL